MNRPVVFHPAAEEELYEALAWYAERSLIAARTFVQEVSYVVRLAVNSPDTWTVAGGNTRRIVFPRFPFQLVFRVKDAEIEIVAIAHQRRRPSYWLDR